MKRLQRYLVTLPVVLAAGLVAHGMQPYFDRTNVIMVYMLAVVVIAFRLGGGPAVMACLISSFLIDFINVPPYFSIGPEVFEYLITQVVMLITVGIISLLAGSLRQKARESGEREAHAAALYALSAELAGLQSGSEILASTCRHVRQAFDADVEVCRREDGRPDGTASPVPAPASPEAAADAADAFFAGDARGRVSAWLPLHYDGEPRGGLRVSADTARLGSNEQRDQLVAMVGQCVQAMERTLLRERVQEKELLIQKQALRNSLLSAVSHDLRTPLASIIGASSSLLAEGDRFSVEGRQRLRSVIFEEAQHMLHMVENLLDMARFQSGDVTLALEWEALEEIAGSAVAAIRRRVETHEVRVAVPHDLPFLRCDGVLVERVIINLLENAVKYSPPGSVVELMAEAGADAVTVTVADAGEGIPEALREKVFDPFFRLQSGVAGGGLGLTICRSIVEAHGGRIRMTAGATGGAVVCFTLPLAPGAPVLARDVAAEGGEE